MFGESVEGIRISDAAISIVTQKSYPRCCLDMVLSLDGKVELGVEHKLWSPEGQDQLHRYCGLGLHGVAFITGYQARIADEVLSDSVYRRPPSGRPHFLWADFYRIVEKHARGTTAATLTRLLLELFDHLGFNPPHPAIGDLLNKDNRHNFAKLWGPTRIALAHRGWRRITRGSIAELWVDEGRSDRVARAWIDPTWVPGVLRIRLTPMKNVQCGDLVNALSAARLVGEDVHIEAGVAPRRIRDREFVQVAIPLRNLFGESTNTDEMADQLAGFVLAVFDAAS
jgi:hypothetical protein